MPIRRSHGGVSHVCLRVFGRSEKEVQLEGLINGFLDDVAHLDGGIGG